MSDPVLLGDDLHRYLSTRTLDEVRVSPDEAEEGAQAAILALLQQKQRYPDKVFRSEFAYALTAATNHIRSVRERQRLQRKLELALRGRRACSDARPEARLEAEELIRRCLSHLEPIEHAVVEAYLVQRMTLREIARATGHSTATCHRILKNSASSIAQTLGIAASHQKNEARSKECPAPDGSKARRNQSG